MSSKLIRFGVLASLTWAAAARGDDWAALKKLLPPSTNAVLAIDAEGLFRSELAKENQWRETHADSFDRNPTLLPPIADRFVLSAELDIEHLETARQLAVMSLTEPVTLEMIQQRIGGQPDEIGGAPAVYTPRGTFIVPLASDRVALVRRAPRQWASRQLRQAQTRETAVIDPLLDGAIGEVANGRSQIVLSVLLADALPPAALQTTIQRSARLSQTGVDIQQLSTEGKSLRGLVFSVRVTDRIEGRVELVFGGQVDGLTAVAKPFMLEMLGQAGAVLPEFRDWEGVYGSQRVGLAGELSSAGLRSVLSLLAVDSSDVGPLAKPVKKPQAVEDPVDVVARVTEQYVKRITRMVSDISRGKRADNLREQVLWTDHCAKTISRMSTQDVRPEVVELGQQVVAGLFEIVSTFEKAADTAQTRTAAEARPPIEWRTYLVPYATWTTPFGRYRQYRPFSYARIRAWENAAQSRQILSDELDKANQAARQTLTRVEGLVAKMNELASQPRP